VPSVPLRPLVLALVVSVSAGAGFYLYRYLAADAAAPAAKRGRDGTEAPAAGQAQDMIGTMRPAFSLPDLHGRERHISEWDGRVLVVNFWATWCPPCLKEIPEFIELQARHGAEGLQFVGIALQKPADVVDFASKHDMNYPVLAGEMPVVRVAEAYGNHIGALPYTVVIDRNGRIVFTRQGPVSGTEMASIVRPLL
jgi:peroxiredoxin